MGTIIENFTLPYKSLIFNYDVNLLTETTLYDNTNLSWTISISSTGVLTIDCGAYILDQRQYCVIVTPLRLGNNHSINVGSDPSINNIINLYCTENQNNSLTNDGFNLATFQINFFNL